MKVNLDQLKKVWELVRPIVQSAREGKKPWQSLSILSNTVAGLLLIFNMEAVADVILNDPEFAKAVAGGWTALQVYLRLRTKGQIKLRK